MNKSDLIILSSEEQVELILWQFEEIGKLRKENEELKSKLLLPKKTSKNSSIPPSKEFKQEKTGKEKEKGKRHKEGGRELSSNPDKTYDFKGIKCLECNSEEINSKLLSSYDKIFLPEVKVETVRINVYECVCLKCKKEVKIDIPEDLKSRELLSENLKGIIMYLHYENYVSYERIKKYFKDIYEIEISEGLIDSVIKSSSSILKEKADEIKKEIQNSTLVCSDETSARVKGKTWWQWVFQNSKYTYHVIEKTRGSIVKENIFGDNHPSIYVSDAFSAQLVGIKEWQVCLAHQIRDCNYLIDLDKNEFAIKMKELFQESIKEKDSSLILKKEKKLDFLLRLDEILKIQTASNSEIKLRNRFSKFKDNLFKFLDYDNVPPTNNSSEQALRPSVIFRKVTNGFRSEIGKDIFANFRTVVDTAKKQCEPIFKTIVGLFLYNNKKTITI